MPLSMPCIKIKDEACNQPDLVKGAPYTLPVEDWMT